MSGQKQPWTWAGWQKIYAREIRKLGWWSYHYLQFKLCNAPSGLCRNYWRNMVYTSRRIHRIKERMNAASNSDVEIDSTYPQAILRYLHDIGRG